VSCDATVSNVLESSEGDPPLAFELYDDIRATALDQAF
jgi:hypothetical protein